ncbi:MULTISPECIES: GntR family transcriptional regulator [Staphylococcus]|nr:MULTISPECIES: GntR family transcriptional regulator [Staphylococcus]
MMKVPEKWLYQQNTGEKIATVLRFNIINGHYLEHTVLTENQIAQQFNVSRSPVRDAFKILNQEHMIRLERMGAEIEPFTQTKQQELTDIRLMIESFAFTKVTSNDDISLLLQDMYQTLEMMRVCVQFKDAVGFAEYDLQFHEHLVYACHHNALMNIWQSLRQKLMCTVYISMATRMESDIDDFKRILDNHRLYIEAVRDRDNTKMYQAFKANFSDLNDNIGAFWRTQ